MEVTVIANKDFQFQVNSDTLLDVKADENVTVDEAVAEKLVKRRFCHDPKSLKPAKAPKYKLTQKEAPKTDEPEEETEEVEEPKSMEAKLDATKIEDKQDKTVVENKSAAPKKRKRKPKQ